MWIDQYLAIELKKSWDLHAYIPKVELWCNLSHIILE